MPLSKTISHCLFFLFFFQLASAQQITGHWKGRIDNYKVTLKLVQKGDSLTGTSYYATASGVVRYAIKGFFDPTDNSVVWWDEQLIGSSGTAKGLVPLLSRGDFNCPGGGRMTIEGKSSREEEPAGKVALEKTSVAAIPDEWDFIIDNYTIGGNDPYLIDSVDRIARVPIRKDPPPVLVKRPEPPVVERPAIPVPQPAVVKTPSSIDQKFQTRKNVLKTSIPLQGDTVEIRFYDNAQVDGDSISLYLNGARLFEHIRLSDKAYTIKLATADLKEMNDLVMVAENLGSIPPNTSYMVAISGSKRYEAQLASTENSSAMIRLEKNTQPQSR